MTWRDSSVRGHNRSRDDRRRSPRRLRSGHDGWGRPDVQRTVAEHTRHVLVTVVLRARSEELGHGALIGWVESTTTGVRVPVRNTWELLEALRSIAAGLGGVAILDAPGTVD